MPYGQVPTAGPSSRSLSRRKSGFIPSKVGSPRDWPLTEYNENITGATMLHAMESGETYFSALTNLVVNIIISKKMLKIRSYFMKEWRIGDEVGRLFDERRTANSERQIANSERQTSLKFAVCCSLFAIYIR